MCKRPTSVLFRHARRHLPAAIPAVASSLPAPHPSSTLISNVAKYPTDKLFTNEKQAELYAKFRPSYSQEVFDKIISFCRCQPSGIELAVDVGCGSGQSTIPLAQYFDKVIGTDVSHQQIANAPTAIPNVSFCVSAAEDLRFIQDSSVDLVTAAQTFHWFNQEKFFKETDRILKSKGCLVVYGYGLCQPLHREAHQYISNLYNKVLVPYWADGVGTILSMYKSVSLPYLGWIRDDSLRLEGEFTIEDLVMGYFGSSSTIRTMLKENPHSTIFEDMMEKFQSWFPPSEDESTENVKVKVVWPVFMLMGRKP